MRLDSFEQLRPTFEFIDVRRNERLLSLPNQTRWVFFDGQNDYRTCWNWFVGLQNVQTHGVGRGIVQHQCEVIKMRRPDQAGQLSRGIVTTNPDAR